ncbi:iron-sulfur protein [Corynebacterium aquilae DSM 44791]|uniref:Iron-sulfur protein n=1 Tax=Corynebacterium aquilae DSM 44791 TaxID=1431546 RepID=A0A1L7CIU3_9CORY|nr:iron-sulfur protein [Corynebacterium aquilae DSM 44791]
MCSRRSFLVATATTAAGALLAACANQGSEPNVTVDAAEVPVGSALVVGEYIITQPEEGVFHAFSARCPHQGAKVSFVDGDKVVCPAHGSVFSIKDGAVISGPSRDGLAAAKLSNKGTELSVS